MATEPLPILGAGNLVAPLGLGDGEFLSHRALAGLGDIVHEVAELRHGLVGGKTGLCLRLPERRLFLVDAGIPAESREDGKRDPQPDLFGRTPLGIGAEEVGGAVLLGRQPVGAESEHLGQIVHLLDPQLGAPQTLGDRQLANIRPLTGVLRHGLSQRNRVGGRHPHERQDVPVGFRVGVEVLEVDPGQFAPDIQCRVGIQGHFNRQRPPGRVAAVARTPEVGLKVCKLDLQPQHLVVRGHAGFPHRRGFAERFPHATQRILGKPDLLLAQEHIVEGQPHPGDHLLRPAADSLALQSLEACGRPHAHEDAGIKKGLLGIDREIPDIVRPELNRDEFTLRSARIEDLGGEKAHLRRYVARERGRQVHVRVHLAPGLRHLLSGNGKLVLRVQHVAIALEGGPNDLAQQDRRSVGIRPWFLATGRAHASGERRQGRDDNSAHDQSPGPPGRTIAITSACRPVMPVKSVHIASQSFSGALRSWSARRQPRGHVSGLIRCEGQCP